MCVARRDTNRYDSPEPALVGSNVLVFSRSAERWVEAQVVSRQSAGLITVEYSMHGRSCRKHVALSSCRRHDASKHNAVKADIQRSMHGAFLSNLASEEEQDPDAYAFAKVVDEEQDWHADYHNLRSLLEFSKFGGVRWLRSDYLFDLCRKGGKMVRYQDLPPHAYFPLKELEQSFSKIDEEVFYPTSRAFHIVAISHPWWKCEEPDPDGDQLIGICAFLEMLLGLGEVPRKAAVFIDYCSLPQHNWFHPLLQKLKNLPKEEQAERWPKPGEHEAVRTLCEQQLFERSLRHMDLVYAHDMTWVLCLDSEIPSHAPKLVPYSERAWCHFERTCGMLKSSCADQLTVSLSLFMDCVAQGDWRPGIASRLCENTPPRHIPKIVDTPDQLAAKLEHMQMASAQTLDHVSTAYCRLYDAKVASVTELNLFALCVADMVQLAQRLVDYPSLEELVFEHCEIDENVAEALVRNLRNHWIAPRPHLYVAFQHCKVLCSRRALQDRFRDLDYDGLVDIHSNMW